MSLLEVRGVHTGYEGIEVLHGVDLDVDDGETVCVLGANGAGKSTVLRAIMCQVPLGPAAFPSRGRTSVAPSARGRRISEWGTCRRGGECSPP